MSFYPQIKKHISPSALSAWHNSRSAFVKSYFLGQKSPETSAMKAGTMVHKLIEMGLYPAKFRFENNEAQLEIEIKDGILVLGKPDSFTLIPNVANEISVVDYKTGKEDSWANDKVASDLKCITTAWLVLMEARKKGVNPLGVIHYLEYIPTEWNEEAHEIRPVEGAESVVYSARYSMEYLDSFTDFILKTIDEVNEEYPLFVNSTDAFVNKDDILLLAELEEELTQAEDRLAPQIKEVKERIMGQFKAGGIRTFSSVLGTVFITEKKTYEFPDDLEATTESGNNITLAFAEECATAIDIAKKNFKLNNEPISITTSLTFKAKK